MRFGRFRREDQWYDKVYDYLDDHTIIGEFCREIEKGLDFVWYTCIQGFLMGIENLWDWLLVIWKDRHWDHSYIYIILEKKLSLQADHIEKYGHHLSKSRDVRNMRTCAELLKRLCNRDYKITNNPWHAKADKRFGKLIMDFVADSNDTPSLTRKVNIYRPGEKTEADIKVREFIEKKAWEYEELMEKQDINLFCTIFKKQSRRWWD